MLFTVQTFLERFERATGRSGGAGHTWLEYDLHHAQRMEGEMAAMCGWPTTQAAMNWARAS